MKRAVNIALVAGMLFIAPLRTAAGPLENGEVSMSLGDYDAAIQLLRPLAERGDAKAEYLLGGTYTLRDGPEDFDQSVLWYRKAADHGYAKAQFFIGGVYLRGEGVGRDAGQAAQWYRKAANQGYGPAQEDLAMMYEDGDGVAQDREQAYMWCSLAIADETATDKDGADRVRYRNTLAAKMTPAQIAEAQRLVREWAPRQSAKLGSGR